MKQMILLESAVCIAAALSGYLLVSNTHGTAESISAGSTAAVFGSTEITDFTFDVQADSHLDDNTVPSLYEKTLAQEKADGPAFVIDLGDTFMTEKLTKTYAEAEARYQLQKHYFDTLGSIPLFLVNGNHDGEQGWNTSQMPEWSRQLREQYFPSPLCSLNYYQQKEQGNYYAFQYGSALFVALDPYSFTTVKRRSDDDGWNTTLGKEQYEWLADTLASSNAHYKFIFIHNLVGGLGKDGRGGMEASPYFEWGGENSDGTDGFQENRAGWQMPIHDLLMKYGVNAVFHGHDHFYARQERDGIIYQMAPQPGTPGNSVLDASKYGYVDGKFLPSAGYLRVHVSEEGVQVEYVHVEESGESSISDSYIITK